MDRKEELERKRQKLAELRRQRAERSKEKPSPVITPLGSTTSLSRTKKEDIDDLVASLVGSNASLRSAGSSVSELVTGDSASVTQQTLASEQMKSSPSVSMHDEAPSRPAPTLTEVEVVLLDLAPKERVVYNKEVQTADSALQVETEPSDEEKQRQLELERQKEQEIREKVIAEERERKRQEEEARKEKEQKKDVKELSEEERKNILTSDNFLDFFDQSTKVIERALNESYDFMRDYTLVDEDKEDAGMGKTVKHICSFFDDKCSKNRTVTDLDWSPKYSELLVASYNKNAIAVNEPDGVVMVWNLHLVERPEFTFYSQSDVLAVKFSPFHSNLIVGGTYSGQILLWDTRVKNIPVLKTPLSAAGHTNPIYHIDVVGTQNAHHLLSASTDGLVCSWQMDMLAQPQEMLELTHTSHPKTDEVAVTTFDFPANETTAFWVGTEEGNVYQANRYDRAGSKAGINQYDTYRGHNGAITGVHFHHVPGPVDFSELFLTSSVDWTIKLWRAKSTSKSSATPQTIPPLHSFDESDGYVYDVKWSPVHPALFSSVDGSGRFDVWNLNNDIEAPTVSTRVGSGKALNKVQWDKEGRKNAIGGSDGVVYVYDIGEMATPRSEDWTSMQKLVYEMEVVAKEMEVPGK